DCCHRIYAPESALRYPPFDIVGELAVVIGDLGPKEDIGQLMAFERAIEQQSHKSVVALMVFEDMKGEQLKNLPVIALTHGSLDGFLQRLGGDRVSLLVKDRGVEITLGSEVAEDDRLVDARGQRDLLSGRAAEAFLREEADGHLDDLLTAILGGHARGLSF